MKKIFLFLTAIFFVSSVLITSVLAQTAQHKNSAAAIQMVHGKIVSINTEKKEIAVKDQKTGEDKTFVVSEKAVSAVKIGDAVKVRVKAGSNIAESVKIVNPEPENK